MSRDIDTSETMGFISSVMMCSVFVIVNSTSDMGPGSWRVKYVEKCDEEYHKFKFDIFQSKINRTHDGFNFKMMMEEDFNEDYAVRVDVCKYVDGGCKPFQVLSDDSCINFINKYAKDNVKSCLTLAGIDPPEFPVAAGEYEVKDFIFDYDELPSDSAYGVFSAKCYVLQDNEEVSCVEAILEFTESDDDDE